MTSTHVLLKDRLGSVDAIIDSATNTLVDSRGYDAFGKPRNGNWSDAAPARLSVFGFSITPKGFTRHEHLNAVELIHMNGRAYDYHLGRFLSVDPFIQSPTNSQSLNPYSYIMNNPLAGTDPTGYLSIGEGSGVIPGGELSGCGALLVCVEPSSSGDSLTSQQQDGALSNKPGKRSNGASRQNTKPEDEEEPSEIGDAKESEPVPQMSATPPTRAEALYQFAPEISQFVPLVSQPNLEAIGDFGSVIQSLFKSNDYGQPMGENVFTREITEGADAKYAQIGLGLEVAATPATGGLSASQNVIGRRLVAGEVSSASVAAIRGNAGSGLNAATSVGVLDNATFAQNTFSQTFSSSGNFAGRTIANVAEALRSGSMNVGDVPIEYIVRDGNTLMLNTRSAQALQQAGIPRSQWSAVNMTGDAAAEARLAQQLQRNGLGSGGNPNPTSSGR